MEAVRLVSAKSNETMLRTAALLPEGWVAAGVAGLAALAVLVIAAVLAGGVAVDRAVAGLMDQARAGLPLATATLTGEIEKQRLIPLTLAHDPDVIALLGTYDANAEANLDRKLKDIAEDAGSTVIYVIGADGRTLATSNFNEPDSSPVSNFRSALFPRCDDPRRRNAICAGRCDRAAGSISVATCRGIQGSARRCRCQG